MTKLTEEQIISHVKLAYAVSKALIAELHFIRDYHNPEVKKILNEAKSRLSHYVKTIEKSLPHGETERQYEISLELLERLYKEVNI